MSTTVRFAAATLGLMLLLPGQGSPQEPAEAELLDEFFRKHRHALRDRDPAVRRAAALTLVKASSRFRALVTDFTLALKDEDEEVRRNAAQGLAEIGPSAREAVPALLQDLKDASPRARAAAAGALLRIEADPDLLVSEFVRLLLKDGDTKVRRIAASALGSLGPSASKGVPALLTVLKDPELKRAERGKEGGGLRVVAVLALGDIGPQATEAVPALLDVLNGDEHHELQRIAAVGLGRIGARDDLVVPALLAALKDEKRDYLRANAAIGLGKFGPKAKVAVPALVEALDVSGVGDPSRARDLQECVLNALARIGPDAKAAIPVVARIAEDPGTELLIRRTAERTLEAISR